MTTILASAPPARRANLDRIVLSRTLSSAPPITITAPAAPRPAEAHSSCPVPGVSGVTRSVYRRTRLRPGDSVVLAHAALRAAGRAQDQPVVGLDDVDDAVEAGLGVEGESVTLHHLVAGLGTVDEVEAHPLAVADHADASVGVEAPRRGVGARQDVGRPLGELDHALDGTGRVCR